MGAIEIINVLDAVITLAMRAGINFSKVVEMRNANGGAELTEAQREQLANDAQDAIDAL